ncbi:MAG TPA: LysR family transcriptional regulator, partial [Candidatus Binataceae bacterium]|nr:LysR family transcriptional regulator [Candidatus Binataceae bacterium]
VESGSFSAAADRLRRSQPAVSVSLRELENETGVRLIERRRSGVLLTSEGREFLPQVKQALSLLDAAKHRMAESKDSRLGRLVIATTDTLATYRLPSVIGAFKRRFPSINLLIHSKQSRAAAQMVAEGEADLGFLPFEAIDPELVAIELGRTRELFVQSARHSARRNRRVVSVKEMENLPLILLSADTLTRQVLEKIFSQAGTTLRPATEAISIEVIKAMVKSGVGCALLPDMAVDADRKAGRLVTAVVREILPRRWGACIRRSAEPSRTVSALLELSRAGSF